MEIKEWLRVGHFGQEQCRPSHAFGPAVRNHYLIHYVRSGRGVFRCEGKVYALHTGQAFLIEPNIITEYEADRDDPWHYAWVGFNGTAAEQLIRQVGASVQEPILNSVDPAETEAALAQFPVCAGRETGRELAVNGCLLQFLSTLTGCAYPAEKTGTEAYLTAAAHYIGQNYSYRITVEEIADHVNVSRSCLFRAFKKAYGCSAQDYLLRIRLQAATDYLCTTDLSITEIAYSCGFTDANHFSKIFMKKKNMSPSHYRNQYRQNAFVYTSAPEESRK